LERNTHLLVHSCKKQKIPITHIQRIGAVKSLLPINPSEVGAFVPEIMASEKLLDFDL
jgi:hypothetical protein